MFNSKILRRTLQSVHDTVTESISKVRDSITEALKEENFKPKVKCKTLKLSYLNCKNLQINWTNRNNIGIHGIPVEVKDGQLEEKVTEIFSQLNISIIKNY